MACINMFNQDHQGLYGGGGGAAAPPPMSPRISFSNDFVLDAATGCPTVRYERTSPAAASDFEFSVESYGMMAADELFFKGRLLPLKEHCAASQMQRMTLRDELLAGEQDDDDDLTFSSSSSSSSSRIPSKVSLRWKTLLGLRKTNPSMARKNVDKKQEKQQRQQQEDGEEEEEEEVPCNTSFNNASSQQVPRCEGRDVEIGL